MLTQSFRALKVLTLVALSASCNPRHERALLPRDTGREFTVAIINPNEYPMNVTYSLGAEQNVLGTIPPGVTRQFTIPDRGGDMVKFIANDPTRLHTVTKKIDLDRDKLNVVALAK